MVKVDIAGLRRSYSGMIIDIAGLRRSHSGMIIDIAELRRSHSGVKIMQSVIICGHLWEKVGIGSIGKRLASLRGTEKHCFILKSAVALSN
jgi:hypothetical protein